MRVRYFAWLKQRTGRAEEEIDPPAGVATVAALAAWLASATRVSARRWPRPAWSAAPSTTEYAERAPIGPGDEVAFFPPVTGG